MESSYNTKEDDAEEFEWELNVTMDSSNDSWEENDEYETDTTEELNEEIDL